MSLAYSYEPPEPNHLVRPVSLGVTATMIVWCFCGWIIDKGMTLEGGLLAVLTGVFQALGFNASAQMRRAADKGRARAKKFWAFVLIVTAGWTAFAAHHAYGVITGHHPDFSFSIEGFFAFFGSAAALVLLTAAAMIDPLLGWAIEDVERSEKAKPEEKAAHAKPDNVVTFSAPARAKPRGQNRAAGMAIAATIAATAPAMNYDDGPPNATTDQVKGNRDRAWELAGTTNLSAAEISRQTGVPESTCKRWRASLRKQNA